MCHFQCLTSWAVAAGYLWPATLASSLSHPEGYMTQHLSPRSGSLSALFTWVSCAFCQTVSYLGTSTGLIFSPAPNTVSDIDQWVLNTLFPITTQTSLSSLKASHRLHFHNEKCRSLEDHRTSEVILQTLKSMKKKYLVVLFGDCRAILINNA